MARNRKCQSAAMRFGPAVKAFVLCLLIGGSGVGYVWQKNQIYRLGQEIKQREVRLAQLEDQNEKHRRQLQMMWSPAFLELRIKELNLGLVPPGMTQMCRLPEPITDLPVPERPRPPAPRSSQEIGMK